MRASTEVSFDALPMATVSLRAWSYSFFAPSLLSGGSHFLRYQPDVVQDMTTLLTADPHFGHPKVLASESGTRPFSSVVEMNQFLIRNWNKVVHDKDLIWILGDFALSMTEREIAETFYALKGRKRLVIGNHDVENTGDIKAALLRLPWDKVVTHRAEIKHGRQRIILDHYAGLVWNSDHHGSYLAYGHSHGKLPGLPGSVDVGMDNQNYTPITVENFVAQADETIRNYEKQLDLVIRNLKGRLPAYKERAREVRELRPPKIIV